jgi:hypothetical protein
MEPGDSVDNPKIANLVEPLPQMTINGIPLDMQKVAEAANRLGAEKGDVLSVGGYRNARGTWVPDYDSARIEKRVCELFEDAEDL